MSEIHVPSISINVPLSSLDDAWRERGDRIAELTRERDEARRHLLAIDDALDTQVGPNAETTLQAVERVRQELHEARAHLYSARLSRDEYLDELEEIRSLLGAGPGVTALEAVKQAQGEHAETLTALAKARQERNEARAELSIERDITRELRASLKIPNGVSLTGTVKRLAEERDEARAELARYVAAVDAAIKHASKVLP